MSEWRQDLWTGRRVIISPERALRPSETSQACPFCEGNESETPPEILARRRGTPANGPGWQLRCVPNRFAAVRRDPPPSEESIDSQQQSGRARGVAEVFIESPHHETCFHALPVAAIEQAIGAWQQRLSHHRQSREFGYVQLFKNQGFRAGASLSHVHSQLIATETIPEEALAEYRGAREHDPLRQRIVQERSGPRWIGESDHLAILAPFVSRFPGEVWLIPKTPVVCLAEFEPVAELAGELQRLLEAMENAFGPIDYNLILKSGPISEPSPHYRFRIEILPRTVTAAGWEWGTGVMINPIAPESTAERIRQVIRPLL